MITEQRLAQNPFARLAITAFLLSLSAMALGASGRSGQEKYATLSGPYFALVQSGDKYGVMDRKGKIWVPIEYECGNITPAGEFKIYILKKGNKYGMIFFNGNSGSSFVLPAFEDVKECMPGAENFCGFKLGGKWGFINEKGEVAVGPEYDDVGFFREGLAPVKIKDKWGYVNESGVLAVEPKYDFADEFYDGTARITENGKYGLINTQGREILKPEYADAGRTIFGNAVYFSRERGNPESPDGYLDMNGKIIIENNSCFQVSKNRFAYRTDKGTWALIDEKKNKIAEVKADSVEMRLFDHVVPIESAGKWGFMDENGKILIEPRFDCIGSGCPGNMENLFNSKKIIKVWQNDRAGLVDEKGKILLEPQFDDIDISYYYDTNLAPANGYIARDLVYEKNGKFGLVAINGSILTPAEYDHIYSFNNGMAEAGLGQKEFGINEEGKIVFEPKDGYKLNMRFDNGMIEITKDKKYGLADAGGKILIEPKYSWIYEFNNGMAKVSLNDKGGNKDGYIDEKGDYVIPPIYDNIDEMKEEFEESN